MLTDRITKNNARKYIKKCWKKGLKTSQKDIRNLKTRSPARENVGVSAKRYVNLSARTVVKLCVL